jgi:hypothetical protein
MNVPVDLAKESAFMSDSSLIVAEKLLSKLVNTKKVDANFKSLIKLIAREKD